ncbi:hypothetical protein ACSQ6I_03750 [Anabaena sp. WFMT]|uniref:hypothetical protein n=1 Tax=Anabaena sp. WFMT TaxID=3449730 RepID=UPI003F26CD99
MAVLDFLISLSNSIPEPMVGLVLATLFILFILLMAVAFLIFLILLQRIPGTGFLFVEVDFDLEEMITRWLTPKPKRSASTGRGEIKRDLQSRLLQLLNNDVDAAMRLINQQRRLHPKKSDRWILEKVIWDLERDRN